MAAIDVRSERLPTESFVVAVSHGPRHSQVTAGGDLDADQAWRLREQLAEIVESGTSRIVLDVGGVRPTDFAALAVLIGGLFKLASHGGQVAVLPPNCLICDVLRRAGVSLAAERFLDTVETV